MTQHEAGKEDMSHMYSEALFQTLEHLTSTNDKIQTRQQGVSPVKYQLK